MTPPNFAGQSDESAHPPLNDNPYLDLPAIGIGMTGLVCYLDESRVVKKPRESQLPDPRHTEYMNDTVDKLWRTKFKSINV
jgi:hypothetical protein